ncbi:MAG TPA: hypothetical protein VMZ52_03840, partial [Bryobacteraceae bacterium]|nr:hypothetical protein [Bryobacteraceae bacterium]
MQSMLLGRATPEATQRYTARCGAAKSSGFYRTAQHLQLSSLGIGSYLGAMDAEKDTGYTDAVMEAVRSGVNVIDTSLN